RVYGRGMGSATTRPLGLSSGSLFAFASVGIKSVLDKNSRKRSLFRCMKDRAAARARRRVRPVGREPACALPGGSLSGLSAHVIHTCQEFATHASRRLHRGPRDVPRAVPPLRG